jgi:hypothetical protein
MGRFGRSGDSVHCARRNQPSIHGPQVARPDRTDIGRKRRDIDRHRIRWRRLHHVLRAKRKERAQSQKDDVSTYASPCLHGHSLLRFVRREPVTLSRTGHAAVGGFIELAIWVPNFLASSATIFNWD